MNYSSLAVCALLALATAARAELACDRPEHDAGRVRGGAAIVHRFTLVNSGKQDLEIDEPRPGCGCLRAAVERRTLSPGESVAVVAEIHTVTQSAGANAWRVLVPYRTPSQQGAVLLQVKAEVVPEIVISPASVVIHTEGALSHPLAMTERRGEPLNVRAALTSSPHVKAHVPARAEKVNEQWQREITLAVGPDCPEGRHELLLSLHTSDPAYPELKVPFTVVKRSARGVQASPATVQWRAMPGEALPARIVLLDCGDEEVRVQGAECDHPAVRCTFADGPGPRTTLRIACEAPPAEGLTATVRVRLSGPKAGVLDVPVRIAR